MKKILNIFVLCILCGFDAVAYTVSQIPNPHHTNVHYYVSNPDKILSPATEDSLNSISVRLHQLVGIEMVVVAVERIDDHIGKLRLDADAFDFSVRLFNDWGIGDKQKNTGVLLLMATSSHDIQLRIGGGLEGILTDAWCNDVVEAMYPHCRDKCYDEAAIMTVRAIANELVAPDAQAEILLGWTPKQPNNIFYVLAVLCLVISLIVWLEQYVKRTPSSETNDTRNHRVPPFIITRGGMGSYGGGFGGSFGGGHTFGGGAGGKW